jgi:hypothetical protein
MHGYPLKERSAVELLDASFDVLRDRFVPALRLYVLPASLVTLMYQPLLRRAGHPDGTATWALFAGTIIADAAMLAVPAYVLTRYLADLLLSRSERPGNANDALTRLPQIVATEVLFLALVVCGLFVIVPGVWAALVFFLIMPVMAVEGTFGTAALSRSRRLMRGHKRRAVPPFVIWVSLDAVIDHGSGAVLGTDSLPRDLLYAALTAFLDAYFVVYSLLLYLDVRFRGDAFDLEVLARRVVREVPSYPSASE